jgi:hypothetical protein
MSIGNAIWSTSSRAARPLDGLRDRRRRELRREVPVDLHGVETTRDLPILRVVGQTTDGGVVIHQQVRLLLRRGDRGRVRRKDGLMGVRNASVPVPEAPDYPPKFGGRCPVVYRVQDIFPDFAGKVPNPTGDRLCQGPESVRDRHGPRLSQQLLLLAVQLSDLR